MNIIKNLPLAITGLILAIFSLGKIFTDFSSVFFIIGTVLVFLVLLKLILHFNTFKNELNNLIALSTFGTFSMAIIPALIPKRRLWNMGLWDNHASINHNYLH